MSGSWETESEETCIPNTGRSRSKSHPSDVGNVPLRKEPVEKENARVVGFLMGIGPMLITWVVMVVIRAMCTLDLWERGASSAEPAPSIITR